MCVWPLRILHVEKQSPMLFTDTSTNTFGTSIKSLKIFCNLHNRTVMMSACPMLNQEFYSKFVMAYTAVINLTYFIACQG